MPASRYLLSLILLLLCNLTGGVCLADAAPPPGDPAQERILFIVSSSTVHGTSALPASVSFGEVVHAWDIFHAAGYAVDFVSPDGGEVPLLDAYVGEEVAARLKDERIMAGLRNTATPARIDPSRYRAVYYVGGSNAMYGVPEDPTLQRIAVQVYERNGGVVSAVCHGTAGIVNLTLAGGQNLLAGKRITGFPERHEQQDAAYFRQFPFLIGQTVRDRGGVFSAVDSEAPYVQVDGRVVTGQNYASARPVAEAVVAVLRSQAADRAAVDQLMQQMMRGFEAGDPAVILEVLRKDGVVVGYSPVTKGMMQVSAEEWAKGFPGSPAADEDQRHRGYEILDVTDHGALVKVTLDYPRWDGVDYLGLAKIEGKWMIISKSWSGKSKPTAP